MLHPPPALAEKTAKILLEIKAINLRPQEPYKLTAGWASPCYIDCRKIIAFPKARKEITTMTAQLIRERVQDPLDIIAGGETAGIPFAAWLADEFDLPMAYVRKKPKGFGRNAQIEGSFKENDHFLLTEDLATDGGSKVTFIRAIREAGARCSDTTVIFYYGVFPNSGSELKGLGVNLHYLTDWHAVIKVIEKEGYFKDIDMKSVKSFLDDPVSWSGRHGGLDTPPDRTAA